MTAPKTFFLGLILITTGCVNGWGKGFRPGTLDTLFLNDDDTEAIPLACSPERPAIQHAGTVVLRAWAKSSPGQQLDYTWTVTVGNIVGSGREVTWTLKGVEAGIYAAQVTLSGAPGLRATCSVSVAIVEPERGGDVSRETGRSLLVKHNKEKEGYGLYSYVLFGSPPTEATHERYVKTLEAYLRFIEVSKFEEEAYPRGKLNITYLPTEVAEKKYVTAAWLLEHYDYARARMLLDKLPGKRKSGVYLVSCLTPLSAGPSPPYLIQDLSAVPPNDLIGWWVDEFLRQTAQEHFWETNTTKLLALRMRTTIAVLAAGLPEVQKSLSSWIAWIH